MGVIIGIRPSDDGALDDEDDPDDDRAADASPPSFSLADAALSISLARMEGSVGRDALVVMCGNRWQREVTDRAPTLSCCRRRG
jgi:hypothetical protein